MRARMIRGAGIAGLVFLAGCGSDYPQDSLDPQGPISNKIDDLFIPILIVAGVVFVLVQGLVIATVVRHRHRPGRPQPKQIHGNTKAEISWTAAPALVLVLVAIPTISTIFDLSDEPKGDVLRVDVFGHMWWWEYQYPDAKIGTANELHIPTGKPVRLSLRSIEPGIPAAKGQDFAAGVIHSFWVPKLAGKQDVVPGRTNKLTIEATKPGIYYGQCAEYCNLAHADMRLRVVAHTPDDYDNWVTAQQKPAVKPTSGAAAAGFELFKSKGCVGCHTVNGVEGAVARVGPDLTHLQSRETFGGATFDMTSENLQKWVKNPGKMKPMRPEEGTGMPNLGLTDDEVDKVVAYLETLK